VNNVIKENSLIDDLLRFLKLFIPKKIFNFLQPYYHGILALSGALFYGQPSKKIKVIGVTGSKGKSTVVFLISKFLQEAGFKTAAVGSLGFKIGEKEWPNNLKMTMPGRWKMHKFLSMAVKEKCQFVVLEVTSEGIKQKRHLGINFDCAVFTNLEKEHIESHGSFEKYYQEKQKLFKVTKNIHILNADSEYVDLFSNFSAKKRIFYGIKNKADIMVSEFSFDKDGIDFKVDGFSFHSYLVGEFNLYNILAAIAAVKNYRVDFSVIQTALSKIKSISGRMEFVDAGEFKVVVDYAHTPESLKFVYKTLKNYLRGEGTGKMLCVLGAAGGGRDKWKRPILGKIAAENCDVVILTNEDPYDEDPSQIIQDVKSGISGSQFSALNLYEMIDRGKAIEKVLSLARKGDIVVITGKGSENSIAVAGGRKIPWSDKQKVLESLSHNK